MAGPDTQSAPMFPIRTVSNLTGVNSVTLRAWERRYQLITPKRTPKGHRLYSQQDIDTIRKVLQLLDQGISIGQVKPMLDQPAPADKPIQPEVVHNEWGRYQQRFLDAIYQFDEQALDAVYNDVLSLYPQGMVITQLITPLLKQLGSDWNQREAGIAEEHFFSLYLRNKIGARLQHVSTMSDGPKLLVACLPDEHHEIGMLLFCLAMISYGYQVSAFGANLPLEQVPLILSRQPMDAVILSATARIGKKTLEAGLPTLVGAVDVPVFVGGAASSKQEAALDKAGVLALGDELDRAVELLGANLADG